MSKLLDISDEFQLIRCINGVKLLRPNHRIKPHSHGFNLGCSVKQLLQLPFSVYFHNTQSELQKANDTLFEMASLNSEKDCLGKTAHSITSDEFATKLIKNDRNVLIHKNIQIIEEMGVRKDDFSIHAISIKVPLYDGQSKLIGLMGCSAILKINSIANFLTKMAEFNLLNHFSHLYYRHSIPAHIHLSLREREVLENILSGYSAKKIGALLKISSRTVEYHLENIKAKFNVYSKSELIEKCLRGIKKS